MTRPSGYVVKSFTVSHSFETYRMGEKKSHFASFSCDMKEPASPEEAAIAGLDASKHVTASVIYEAVARGCLTQEEGKQMLHDSEIRHQGILDALSRKVAGSHGSPGV